LQDAGQHKRASKYVNDFLNLSKKIGDLPTSIQVKLLRVLEEGTFERLGSSKTAFLSTG
jgi:transcriptional regulator of acetoin/glycerol metabolism